MKKQTPSPPSPVAGAYPPPTGFLAWLLGGMFALWLLFAILINWAKVGEGVYASLVMDVPAVLRGQVWRFFTAPFIHNISAQQGVAHIVVNSLLLYSSGRHLQKDWGGRRLATVLFSAALAAELFQLAAFWLLPPIGQPVFYGSYAMSFAAIAAYGFSNRDTVISIWFWTTRAVNLVWISLAFYLLVAIAAGRIWEGLLAPFVGAGVGYLLGGGTPSPVRRFFLKRKLAALEKPTIRPEDRHLRLVPKDEDGDGSKKGKDADKWLN